jgi:glycosyltransferase involved in cell wall biosynthesis
MLAVLTTHPIQYQVPLWQELARDGRVPFEVWYLTDHGTRWSRDREFGRTFKWDLDTLSGYPYTFLDVQKGASPNSFWMCRLRERLRDRLKGTGALALWIQGWQVGAYWQAVREAKTAGIELWLRAESNNLGPRSWLMSVQRSLKNRWFFRHVDRFFYIGEANRQLYEEFGVEEDKLYPARYAVDNGRFALQAASLRLKRNELRQQWGIPDDAFCVLFCGKFIPKKRPLDLIAAARILIRNNERPQPHLLFVGSGVLGCEIRRSCKVVFDAEAAVLSLPNDDTKPGVILPRASFAGFLNQTEISKAYVAADCLVLPSDYSETWGLVVNEALASGLPCLVSRACGCAGELAGNGAFDLGNINELANKLTRFAREGCEVIAPPMITETVNSIARAYLQCKPSSC